jgi:signal transduction histidine kinase
MRLPLSLHIRVALLSLLMVLATLAFNISGVLSVVEGVVADNIDVQLDTQIRILSLSLEPDGTLDKRGLAHFPGLLTPPPGWGWEVRSGERLSRMGVRPGQIEYPIPRVNENAGIYSGKGTDNTGALVHVRRLDMDHAGTKASIVMMNPRQMINREVNFVQRQMYLVAAEVCVVLMLTAILQLRIGLKPLRQLVQRVAMVRAGQAEDLPSRQPADLQPLAHEINALIARNRAGIEAARINAANLAHSVKTPLSSLMLQLEHEGSSQEARDLLKAVSERVSQHLRRARNATSSAPAHAQVRDVAQGVLNTVARARRVNFDNSIPTAAQVAVAEDDLREMLGNLVENASRFATGRVRLCAQDLGGRVAIHVDDDGAGIPDSALAAAMRPGVRLDEAGEGYGLGLAIVHEMAGFNGGSLKLSASPMMSGLRATLELPG